MLKQIVKRLDNDENQIKTYGVEVDQARSKVAMELLDYCSNAAIETMVVQRNVFQLIYLNPPYDFEMLGADDVEGAKRKEFIGYFKGLDSSTGAFTLESHDESLLARGIGTKNLLLIEKYQVDVLGRYNKVGNEERQDIKIQQN
ncbi:CRISPR-associated protein Csn1 [Bacillus cereus group sp. MYBK12-2]|uniref:CRISPR-associated protein Csn1 n=3 Tax=Bacillus cereus group TaxID=86661 RepID=A0ABV4RYL9_9BACI|nr:MULTISPECIES: CRISPR-associated protein Csn1 [Bacillus cereus group]MCC2340447.1 CRISPR-associated protein Csn1 [Bacillus tropicus]MCC2357486.1 CRISPR-associated protein Csn1 [Bacillus paranthracis]MCC2389685.1 CRISPR-associated protein Csn1 [Bacillus pacificus]MCC2401822.1 CRISPR-associated protein Csn1 [Bacillus paranthracis]MCC2413747.1 CRISPR-associated protein Csn1 [Bacillus paranthracis]